jgi:hypothetical protein
VPALDLALGLGVVRCTADVRDALAFEPVREIARDVGRPVVAEQPGGRWTTLAVSQPEAARASSSVSVTSLARMLVQSFQATMKRE